jgi:PHD-finger
VIPSNPIVRDDKGDVTLCLCGRNVPEGEMVLCEECDTWQHIVCYYPSELVPAVHFCENCGSKYLDAKRSAKRQKLEPQSAFSNNNVSNAMKAQPSGPSAAQAISNQHRGAASPDLGSPGIPSIIPTIGEQDGCSSDEPVASTSSKKIARGNFETDQAITTKTDAASGVGGCQQIASGAAKSGAAIMDLVSDTEADYVKVELDDNQSLENASTLPSQCMTTAASSVTDVRTYPPIPNNLMTPTSTTPSMAPQPTCLGHSPLGASTTPQLVSNATTFVFIDSQNRELRRRTFEDLGGRLNVGTLFGQAIRSDLIDKFDESAILSVSIRGFDETFEIPKHDKPDFARLMQRIQAAGLCMVEVRLS